MDAKDDSRLSDYNMYVDESYDKDSPYIALVGVIVRNDKWQGLNQSVRDLKVEMFGDPNFNLKKIRRKKYDKDKSWEKLSQIDRDYFDYAFDNMLKDNITVLAALINRMKMNNKDNDFHFKLAYSFLIERYEYFLEDFDNSYGAVIMDKAENSSEVKGLKALHDEILTDGVIVGKEEIKLRNPSESAELGYNGVRYKPVSRIVENLTYQRDDDNNFLQIADLIASAFSYDYNKNKERFSSRFMPLLRKSKSGDVKGYGLKEFPT